MGNSWSKDKAVQLLEDIRQKSRDKAQSVRTLRNRIRWLSQWKSTAAVGCLFICFLTAILHTFHQFGVTWSIIACLLPLLVFAIVWMALPAFLQKELNSRTRELGSLNEDRRNILEKVKTTQMYEDAQQLLSVYDGDAFDISVQL
ncbi:uncharacterized protein LOC135386052 isoform X3 [Ornithodoros turicata]|uniref:uncharacterized protein LOC135386052 isoform X3 n=1 Tax=Ornithodoros turicata TaxID=34597 RepID=UPI0031398AF5